MASDNFEMFPCAEKALLEFWGISVDKQGSGETCAREPFVFDPTMAIYEGDRFSLFSTELNIRLYPLGEAIAGNYYWTIAENEHVYLLMEDLLVLGKNLDEALENLLVGRLPSRVRP